MDFTINGHPVWFNGITGTVRGLQNWSSSDISSSGGGGFISLEGGYIEPTKITTTVNQHQKFWIVTDWGREQEIDNPNFHCREGHRVTLIWGADKGKKEGAYVLFLNHTTGESAPIKSVDKYSQFKKSGYRYINWMATGVQLSFTLIFSPIGIPMIIFAFIMGIIKSKTAKEYATFIKNLPQNKEFMQSIS